MTKLQNVAPYPIDGIVPGQTIEVESTDAYAGLIAAGLLVVVDEPAPAAPSKEIK